VGSTLWGSKSCDFKSQNIKTPQFPNHERKVGPAFLGFGVRDFVTSSTQQQHIQTSKIRKRKGETHILGFRGLELRKFRCPNINIYKILKCKKGKVRPIFQDSGFGTSQVLMSKHRHIQTFKMQKRGKVRPPFRDFRVQNFASSGVQTLTYTNFRNAKNGKMRPAFRDFRVWNFTSFDVQTSTYLNPIHRKTKGIDTFFPTVEQGSKIHFPDSPPSLTMNP
jgi:hypothetical protein